MTTSIFKDTTLFAKKPVIHEVGGQAFYVCGYTGIPINEGVGVPGFILGKKASDSALYGRFKDWNVVFRMIKEAHEAEALTDGEMGALTSWFAETYGDQQVQMAPSRSRLIRFGGDLADDDFGALYVAIQPLESRKANVELHERLLAKRVRSDPPPMLASSIKELATEDGVDGPSFFECVTWPRVPGFFAVRRVDRNELEGTACSMLDVQMLPHNTTSAAIISGPPAGELPKTVNAWLDKKCRPAKLAGLAAAKKLEAERKKRERLAKRAEKRPAHLGVSAKPKKATKAKRTEDMASFAKAAEQLVSS